MPSSAQLWQVYHVTNCRHTSPPKDKFVVIVHIDGNALGVFINTRISSWIQARPNLIVCETTISAAEHPFLNYDSWVDCQDLYPYTDAELVSGRGIVSETAKCSILNAIHLCPKLERKYKNAILARENWSPIP